MTIFLKDHFGQISMYGKSKRRGSECIENEIVICAGEYSYAEKLAAVLVQRKEVFSQVRICSSFEKLETLPDTGHVRILLIGEDIPYGQRRKIQANRRIVLTEEGCQDLGNDEAQIHQYQSADCLVAEILGILQAEGLHRQGGELHKRRILGVYSPLHRIGKTTYAVKLGKELAETENVLYLNLETCAGVGGYFRQEEAQNLSHLLYFVKQDAENISLRISSLVRHLGRLDYIPPIQVWTDLAEVTPEEWRILFQCLTEQSIYHTMIVDFGESVKDLFRVLDLCDRLLVPVRRDVYGEAKLKQYHLVQKMLGFQNLEAKTFYIDMDRPVRQAVRETTDLLQRKE